VAVSVNKIRVIPLNTVKLAYNSSRPDGCFRDGVIASLASDIPVASTHALNIAFTLLGHYAAVLITGRTVHANITQNSPFLSLL